MQQLYLYSALGEREWGWGWPDAVAVAADVAVDMAVAADMAVAVAVGSGAPFCQGRRAPPSAWGPREHPAAGRSWS